MTARYLEISVQSDDLIASVNFYRALGFTELVVGDAWAHPYAVVSDGTLAIGLHDREIERPALTMVMQDLARTARLVDERNLVSPMHLDEDIFNEVQLHDNDGNRLSLVEARTFSPASEAPDASLLGRCLEYTLPVRDVVAAAHFWAPYAPNLLAMQDEPMHFRFDAGGLPLGLSGETRLRQPFLCSATDDITALGLAVDHFGARLQPCDAGFGSCLGFLMTPEGLRLTVFDADFINA